MEAQAQTLHSQYIVEFTEASYANITLSTILILHVLDTSQPHLYMTGVIATKLKWHSSNINVIFSI